MSDFTGMKTLIQNIYRSVNRKLFNIRWYDLRQVKPVSQVFGLDRGLPIDRYYIEHFLRENGHLIRGTVLEIGDDNYSKRFGINVASQEILNYTNGISGSTIVGDLTDVKTLKPNLADCFICTQTLNFIFDVHKAVKGIYYLLNHGGTALVTVAGISQISRYDMDRWGDYWRFTDRSITRLFSDVFGVENIQVRSYGNVLASIAFLEGISAEELTMDELLEKDVDYQTIIAVTAYKE